MSQSLLFVFSENMDKLLDYEFQKELLEKYDQAESLLNVTDPESEPYKSKYECRNSLNEIISFLKQHDDSHHPCIDHSNSVKSSLYCLLGCIDIEVQELAQGEKDLQQALLLLEQVKKKEFVVLTAVKAYNQLGVLWCIRDDHEKAKNYLDLSQWAYEEFNLKRSEVMDASHNSEVDNPGIYGIRDLLKIENLSTDAPNSHEKEKALDLLNAYTYYYLAQVYQKLEKPKKSAECCHKTLSKQLELKEYKAVEWATNAATLSHHYIACENFRAAKSHLGAAVFILDRFKQDIQSREFGENEVEEKEELEDTVKKCEADIARSWGKYTLVLLQTSMDALLEDESEEPVRVGTHNDDESLAMQVEDIELGERSNHECPSTDREADDDKDYFDDFPSIEIDPDLLSIPHTKCKTFEEARSIFLPGQRYFNAAKCNYYTMNEHCTDYAEINQDLSYMHKVLIFFETDADRQFKMQKRRVDLLEEIVKELNMSVYKLLIRQVLFEIAEIYSAMMDLKSVKWQASQNNETPNQENVQLKNKINSLTSLSINNFTLFHETLKNADGSFPKTFNEDTVRPALLAHFHMGRLYDKYVGIPEVSQQKIKNKLQSYCHFKTIVDYCSAHDGMDEVMKNELPICKELVQLMPVKIQKMKRDLDLQQRQ